MYDYITSTATQALPIPWSKVGLTLRPAFPRLGFLLCGVATAYVAAIECGLRFLFCVPMPSPPCPVHTLQQRDEAVFSAKQGRTARDMI